MPARPIALFVGEGYDKAFFSQLVKAEQPFVTWDKNVDSEHLPGIDDKSFTLEITFNGKSYSVFEEEKTFCHTADNETEPHKLTLRHLIIRNRSSNRAHLRPCPWRSEHGRGRVRDPQLLAHRKIPLNIFKTAIHYITAGLQMFLEPWLGRNDQSQ